MHITEGKVTRDIGDVKASEGRTKLTLNPYLQLSGKSAIEESGLNECDSSDNCPSKVNKFREKLKDYCHTINGHPAVILIIGHGSFGKILKGKLTGESIDHPQNARPYVLTSSGGGSYKALHIPKKIV